jgi:hypothetical protein
MKETSPFPLSLHVALDYAFVLIGMTAPWTLGFQDQTAAMLYTLLLATFGLGLNVVTRYPGGAWKVLPFKWHRYVEWAAPPAFIAVPWLFFPSAGAMPYVLSALGIGIFTNATLTRPTSSAEAESAA